MPWSIRARVLTCREARQETTVDQTGKLFFIEYPALLSRGYVDNIYVRAPIENCRLYLHRITSTVISWAYMWHFRQPRYSWWRMKVVSFQGNVSQACLQMWWHAKIHQSEWESINFWNCVRIPKNPFQNTKVLIHIRRQGPWVTSNYV